MTRTFLSQAALRGAAFGACLLAALPAHAEPPRVELPQLFSQRAELGVTRTGLQTLELPLEVIRACRPGLSDLRLWSDGQEVPYLIDSTGPEPWVLAERRDAKVSHITHDRTTTLCPLPGADAKNSHCEAYELVPPPAGEGWELVFEVARPQFVERVELSTGAPGSSGSRSESIFRLPGPGERLRIALPPSAGPISLTLIGEGPALSPRLRYERGKTVRGTDLVDDSLVASETWRDRLGTHLLLDRPLGVLPTALRFSATTGAFDRRVQIYDHPGADSRRLIGEGRITRISVSAGGARLAIDQLDVPLGVPRSRKLEVVIEDGDSPRLDALSVRAVLRRPILLFNRDSVGAVELLFGGGRVEAPHYDLQALLPESLGEGSNEPGAEGLRAQIAARLRQREGVAQPALGPLGKNPRFDPTPALATVAHAGAALDLSLFSHLRPLEITPSPDGLSRYVLGPADLAAARPDLGDIRVVDAQGRQWPYVVDREIDARLVELPPPRAHSEGGITRYELALPAAPLPLGELTVDCAEGFFDRALVVVLKDQAGRERRIDGLRLSRTLGQKEPIVLRYVLPHDSEARSAGLTLEVTDGGDAPLHLTAARLRVPTAGLLLAATSGSYRLIAGNPEEQPPTYELRSLDALLAQLDAAEVRPGELVANPAFSSAARLRVGGGRERLLVWLALGLAVLVLGGLTFRLARAEQGPPA